MDVFAFVHNLVFNYLIHSFFIFLMMFFKKIYKPWITVVSNCKSSVYLGFRTFIWMHPVCINFYPVASLLTTLSQTSHTNTWTNKRWVVFIFIVFKQYFGQNYWQYILINSSWFEFKKYRFIAQKIKYNTDS